MAQPTKVFVGSLPPGTKPEELRHLFENYGIVVECDVMNRCGFVHMKNAAMAESAISALHETDFKGQSIVVEFGRPKERKQGGGAGGGKQGGPRDGRGGGGGRGIMVGFPGKQSSNNFNQAATLQLAGVIMELLGDPQNQIDDISGGKNNMRGGGGDSGFRRGVGGPQGGAGGRGNFQGNRGGNQNMNGVGPMRNQGFKGDRPAPYSQGINMGGPNGHHGGGHGGGRFNNNNPNRGVGASGPAGNYNNSRGGNFAPKAATNNYGSGNDSWNNNQRSGMPPQNDASFAEDNFSGGFSGNMGNSNNGNFGGQQDRRGFALPVNQFQQFGGGNQMGGFGGNDSGTSFEDDAIFQRRNNHSNPPIIIDFRSGQGAGNFNRGGNSGGRTGGGPGGFQNNRGGQGFQQGGGFKRGGNNMNSGENYQQNFPPLGGNNGIAQGGFGGNNRNQGVQGGRGGGGGMNRNAPRQNIPNRRY